MKFEQTASLHTIDNTATYYEIHITIHNTTNCMNSHVDSINILNHKNKQKKSTGKDPM